jgi:hypothetical protein
MRSVLLARSVLGSPNVLTPRRRVWRTLTVPASKSTSDQRRTQAGADTTKCASAPASRCHGGEPGSERGASRVGPDARSLSRYCK